MHFVCSVTLWLVPHHNNDVKVVSFGINARFCPVSVSGFVCVSMKYPSYFPKHEFQMYWFKITTEFSMINWYHEMCCEVQFIVHTLVLFKLWSPKCGTVPGRDIICDCFWQKLSGYSMICHLRPMVWIQIQIPLDSFLPCFIILHTGLRTQRVP